MGNQTGKKETPAETSRKEVKENDKTKTQDEHEKTDKKVNVHETIRAKNEIANEIKKNTNLKAWLQHCTLNQNYSITMQCINI
ncbi:hypothetical protein RFI_22194 [Reticulomyxa filosa]|uniref:Uncharacterized protein n=1 Tax=Reticulomyxa filosa TaxID=46433 RepID=X6MPZ2_RETFI|nr:hypothetical protein RFI_22194 [Reticulomyxa filosa]|eukprot:ETO15170.1 hypothetical protein RFI_22194 [Reticulomyxa filosa]